jgi:S1-C subfamily serine protease
MPPSIALSIGLLALAAPPDAPRAVREGGLAATVRVSEPATGSVGTGVVIGVRGGFAYVLTAAHIIGPDAKLQVETFAPQTLYETVEVVFRAPDADVAVVRVPAGRREWATVVLAGPPAGAAVPTAAWAVGCDDGKDPQIEAVTLTGRKLVKKRGAGAFFWQARGETVRGRSGGPLLNADGRLIGVCSGTQDGMSYYSHPDEIQAALPTEMRWVLTGDKK